MIIVDDENNRNLDSICLLLKKSEANQLIKYLESLVVGKSDYNHCHLNNEDYSKELTVAVYSGDNVDSFSEEYKLLIEKDK